MEKFWQKLGSFAFHRSQGDDKSCTKSNTENGSLTIQDTTIAWFKKLLGYPPSNSKVYVTALTHRSIVHDQAEPADSNQRLEFLGDAVLDLIISEHLYTCFPDSDEGKLSSNRAKIVNRKSLAGFARKISLSEHLLIGESADKSKICSSESTLADAFEALIGAIYLDMGLAETKNFIQRHVISHVDLKKLDAVEHNYKSRLIEYTQSRQLAPPVYAVVSEEGAEHEKLFTIEVSCDGKPLGRGTAGRKKDAEQSAAKEALATLETGTG
ncbi:ribonuclease III [Prosthecochloris marina]|uniref:Ribonuclease 3 n=1 Tax=Prosthecochloris marina TaxID=2017681 RepID=A0A317T8A7_9CHLB|nr:MULTISPECIES: ribonuclease III [Prosthecochloris]PWW82924.1 ribonuclease III [Prosthecochloris marina]